MVEVAHFDPIPVQVSMEGIYPTLSLNLPRMRDDVFSACLEEAKAASSALTLHTITHKALTTPATNRAESVASSRAVSTKSMRHKAADMAATSRSVAARSEAGKTVTMTQRTGVTDMLMGPDKKLDLEAERLRLVRLLDEQEAMRRAMAEQDANGTGSVEGAMRPSPSGDDIATQDQDQARGGEAPGAVAGSPVRTAKLKSTANTAAGLNATSATAATATSALGKKLKPPPQPPVPALYSAHYVLDFGCVTKGTTRTRKFRMANPSSQSVTLRFDKALLEAWCFKADPEAISKLPGAPECGLVDVTFTLQANKSQVQLGAWELIMPLDIKGSLPVLLTLKANIQVG